MSDDTAITAASSLGRVLLALRAGPMSSGELGERFPSVPSMRELVLRGYVSGCEDGYRITDAGRAACPLRNPLAAIVQKPKGVAPLTRSFAAIGLPMKTTTQRPFNHPAMPENRGGIRMPNTATIHKPTAVDLVRRALIDSPQGVARKDLINSTGLKPAGVDKAIANLIKIGEAERKAYGVVAPIQTAMSIIAVRLEQGDALATAIAEQAATAPSTVPEPVSLHEPAALADAPQDMPEIDFMIHADGRLTICDGEEILVIPPAATRRLGYFLGCLEKNTWPPRLDPEALHLQLTA